MKQIKKCREYFLHRKGVCDESGDFTWQMRLLVLLLSLIAAGLFTFIWSIPDWLIGLMGDKSDNGEFVYSITILTFGIIFGIGGWIIRTHDKKKEFKDVFQQQNETVIMKQIKKCKEYLLRMVYGKSGDFTWFTRFVILVGFLLLAYFVTFEWGVPDWLIGDKFDNYASVYSITILTFGIIFGIGGWIIRTHDKKKEFKDVFQQHKQQHEHFSQQYNETLFSNALQLLFKTDDKDYGKEYNRIANSVGLKELIKLRQTGAIEKERIDLITSSGLELEDVPLHNANLSGADLSNANLMSANLMSANLSNAILRKINLSTIILDKETNLISANLSDADLCYANLSDANLLQADLSDADLRYANLNNVVYDEYTQFSNVIYNAKTLEYIKDDKTLTEIIKKGVYMRYLIEKG